MDPSVYIAKIYGSWSGIKTNLFLVPYSVRDFKEIKFKLSFDKPKKLFKYINEDDIISLQSKELVYKSPYFIQAIMKTDPFKNVGNSIFRYPESMVMANIDAIIDLTYHYGGNLAHNSASISEKFNFVDINGAPGGFSEYINWRIVNSYGVGISLTSDEDEYPIWNEKILEIVRQFYIFEGTDYSGDINSNLGSLIKWLGIDTRCTLKLITSRLTPKNFEKYLYIDPENQMIIISSSKDIETLLSTLLFSTLRLCHENGSLMIELPNIMENIIVEIIYIITTIFNEVYLMKPITGPIHTSIIYLVGKKLRDKKSIEKIIDKIINILKELKENDSKKLTSLLSTPLPDDFINWINTLNKDFINLQLNSVTNAEKYIEWIKIEDPDKNSTPRKRKESELEETKNYENKYEIEQQELKYYNPVVLRQINRVRLLGSWNIPDSYGTKIC